jgi:two-component system phosphate regulon response regulator OmpR
LSASKPWTLSASKPWTSSASKPTDPPSATTGAPPFRRPMLNALVAEDSITARIFLARLLTRLGFDVNTVDTAAALRAELERCSWSLVCVDIELPDEDGTAFLAGLAARHGARTPFVALVRDADDRVAARDAGFERMLRKPFDHQELEQVLGHLGLLPRRS